MIDVEVMKASKAACVRVLIGLALITTTGCASTPVAVTDDRSQSAYAQRVDRAVRLVRTGDTDDAQVVLQLLIREGNREQDVLVAMSVCAMQTGDFGLALWSIEECARIHGHSYETLYNLGVLYRASKRYQEAEDTLRLALEYPEHAIECIAEYTYTLSVLGQLHKENLGSLVRVENEHPDPVWREWAFQQRVRVLSADD